ncbi:MAG: phage tail tape measure protein, partial [Clostridiaceae bacterium]|nr:phage tail tape measure protein [Clostridiaceae bacterium]
KLNKVANKFQKTGKEISKVGKTLSKRVTLPLVGLGTAAVKVGKDFDEGMSQVKAISGATEKQFKSLRKLAIKLGEDTKYSAQDAADGMTMLARAGWDVDSIMGGMPGLFSLAAASNTDLAIASSIVADSMSIFAMNAREAGKVADVLTAAANGANTDVTLLGESLAYGGAAAAAAGMDIEQTSAILMAFANANIKGSRAGTALEAMLRDLRKASEDGAISIGDMNIALYDSEGNMRDLISIMADVETATAGMTGEQRDAELGAIFMSQALRGVNVMLQRGTEDIFGYEEALRGSNGTAKETADIMVDNLGGALEELQSTLETLAIAFSDIITPVVRELTEKLIELTHWFNELDEETKETIVNWATLAAVVGPIIWLVGKLVSGIGVLIKGISLLAGVGKGIAIVGGGVVKIVKIIGGAIGALAAVLGLPAWAVGLLIAAIAALVFVIIKYWDEIKAWTIKAWGDIKKWFTETLPEAFRSFIDWVKNLWKKTKEYFSGLWKTISDAVTGIYDSITTWIGNAIDSVVNWFKELPKKIGQVFSDLGTWISETAVGIWESLTTWIGGAVDNIVTFFSEMPGKVMAFMNELFTEKIPYAIGYAVGWVVRTLSELIDTIVTFFSELPGKVWTWLQNLWEDVKTTAQNIWETATTWISDTVDAIVTFFKELPGKVVTWLQELWETITETVSNIWETATTWISDTVNDIVEWFKALPGRIWEWLKTAYDNVARWVTDVYETVVGKISETINAVVNWFKELPTRIWTWLTDTIAKIKQWAVDAFVTMKTAAKDMVDGFIEWVKKLPSMVWDALLGVKDKIVDAAKGLKDAAVRAATNLWNGFKAGLGIKSPSYLEEAMMDIMDKSKETTERLGGDFKKLGRLTVKPTVEPSGLDIPKDRPRPGGSGVGGVALAGADGWSGPIIQIEKMEVRSDDDIKRVSRELKGHIDDTLRGEGYK